MEFQNRKQLKECLRIERLIYFPDGGAVLPFGIREKDILWTLVKKIRKVEYHDCMNHRIRKLLYKLLLQKQQNKYALHIPPHTCEMGLSIAHVGPIIINEGSKIGKNLRIHVGVNIGANGGKPPKLGESIYIGPGAKVFGEIYIANKCRIGANAVVNKSCMKENCTLIGVPAITRLKT